MYFKSLELFGFKSFAERTRLDFEPGITAIVGPNGCGKSNIADSIKWVLGEQSPKMLRGGKMEDVIFNGTDGKEPVNYSEVSITLDNHDRILPIEYDEVTITRRLYRSGESEYLLNKTQVRLKDINELFMGTGIGTSAYSLIEQGRIDQVLSSKPEDRREVFEEASGITKYKAKKKEALRRLEDTEQNLLRINDIIAEVKRQIDSIERQAKKAERYKERYEELKSQELKLSRIELEMLRQKVSQFDASLDDFKTKEEAFSSGLNKTSEELSSLNIERPHIEARRMDLKSSVMKIDSEISKSRDKVSLNKERIEELKKKQMALASEMEKNQESMESQQKEVEGLREKVSILQHEDTERASILSEKEARLHEISKIIHENEINISTAKANVLDIASKQSKLRNQLAKISTTLNTHEARLKRLETESQTISAEKNILDAKLSEAVNEMNLMEREAAYLRAKRDEVSGAVTDLASRIEALAEQAKEHHKIFATNKSRLEVLEEAKAKYEGFSSGVRAILHEARGNTPVIDGVRDVLTNLLSVKKGYEIALEAVLGDYLEAVVVDRVESAENAVRYLSENSIGRASFIHPGSFAGVAKEQGPNLKDTRILGRAVEFIEIGEDYRDIMRHILKNTFIVNSLQDAVAVLNEPGALKEYTFVTLSGEIVKNGFVSGGAPAKEGVTLINREVKIKELSETIAKLEEDSHRLERDISNCEVAKRESELELQDLGKELNEKEILLANARNRHANIEENIKDIIDEISLATLEIDEVRTEMARFREEENTITQTLAQSEKDALLNEERIKTSESSISEYTKEKERFLIEIAEQKTELGALESRKEGLSGTLSLLESSLNDAKAALEARKTEAESAAKKVEELSGEITGLEDNMKKLSEERARQDAELGNIEGDYSAIMQKINEGETILRQSEKEASGLRSKMHEIDLKKAEVNYSINNLSQRIKDVYKTNLDELQLPDVWQDMGLENLRKEVEENRQRLDSMGPVNLVAIEEHSELQARYAFLTNQRDDLLKAKETLLKAIAKINKTTKELFIETFTNIQNEFRNFFKMLFGGGNGDLILLDEENILESGIEIVARPPGKRLQNVSLLSGGEKALTAIALIFAIFKVKPSPFCVLDEIDAPLDESNIGRFSKSLEIFSDTSQFIVITHNKKTIDMADLMYGITMQESGISKVVSVKFLDGKKENTVDAASG